MPDALNEAPDPYSLPLGRAGRIGLAGYLVVLVILLSYTIIKVWPPAGLADGAISDIELLGRFRLAGVTADVRLIVLVMVVGALGSYLHAVASFVNFAGNRALIRSWVLWYAFRPLVGMPLALIFYFAVRGGFLSGGADQINPFGIAAMAGLVGMFSDQASDKLRDLFANLFAASDARADKMKEQPTTTAASAAGGEAEGQAGSANGNATQAGATSQPDDNAAVGSEVARGV